MQERFRIDPEYYLGLRKAIEKQIKLSFRHNLKGHLWQKLERTGSETIPMIIPRGIC
jgi:hypothetical protein